jgi:hypothetical protein
VRRAARRGIDVTLGSSIDDPKKLDSMIAMTFSRAAGTEG